MKKDSDLGSVDSTVPRRLRPYLTLAVLLALSVVGWRFYLNLSREREQERFEAQVDAVVTDITDRLERCKMILQGGGYVFLASEMVTREEWQAHYEYRQVSTLCPGIQGMGFITVVRPEDLARHLEHVQAEGFADYTVWPAGEREVYTSVVFLEPIDALKQRAFGDGMFTEPARRKALARARDSGEVALSGRVALAQNLEGDAEQSGFLVYAPAYTHGTAHGTSQSHDIVSDQRAVIEGYVYAAFRIDALMDGLFVAPSHEIDFWLYDGAEVSPPGLMYDSHVLAEPATAPRQPMFSARRILDLYGQQWTLEFETMPAFEAAVDPYTSGLVLGAGLLISLLVFLLHKAQADTASRAQALAVRMTLALRESDEQLRLRAVAIESVADAIVITGPDGRIQWVNPAFTAITGFSSEEATGQTPRLLKSGTHDPAHYDRLWQTIQKGEPWRGEMTSKRKDGSLVTTENIITPLRAAGGEISHFVAVQRDVTERRQAEAERVARLAAEAASREKSQFLATMSHEIRTPMNGVIGMVEVLEQTALTPSQADMVQTIRDAALNLLRLIDDILDFSKAEAGHLELERQPVALAELLEELCRSLAPMALTKGIRFDLFISPDLPQQVIGDALRLRQLFYNLLGNAIKFESLVRTLFLTPNHPSRMMPVFEC